METFDRRDMLRLLPLIARENESLKAAKMMFPEAPYISESIAINEKLLSYKKQLEESTDRMVPRELVSFFFHDVAGGLLMACTSISNEEEAIKKEELFLRKNRFFSKN